MTQTRLYYLLSILVVFMKCKIEHQSVYQHIAAFEDAPPTGLPVLANALPRKWKSCKMFGGLTKLLAT